MNEASRRRGITMAGTPNSCIEASGEPITAMARAGAAGHGPGDISEAQREARADAVRRGVVFASTSRTGSGSAYAADEGLVAVYDLLPQKARILLQLGLSFGLGLAQLHHLLKTIGTAEYSRRRP